MLSKVLFVLCVCVCVGGWGEGGGKAQILACTNTANVALY